MIVLSEGKETSEKSEKELQQNVGLWRETGLERNGRSTRHYFWKVWNWSRKRPWRSSIKCCGSLMSAPHLGYGTLLYRVVDGTQLCTKGIPELRQQMSSSPPSIPSPDNHQPVTTTVMDFWVMPQEEFRKISSFNSRIWLDADEDGFVNYASENDAVTLVTGLVRDLIKALRLPAQVFT